MNTAMAEQPKDNCLLRPGNTNCGGCGMACAAGEVCNNGSCAADCDPGLVNCNGACADLNNDLSFCGSCTNNCNDDSVCTVDSCNNGECSNVSGAGICNDGNPCTQDMCDAQAGCTNTLYDVNDWAALCAETRRIQRRRLRRASAAPASSSHESSPAGS